MSRPRIVERINGALVPSPAIWQISIGGECYGIFESRRDAEVMLEQARQCANRQLIANIDYEMRVRRLEAEGLDRSDAQGVADAEAMKAKAGG